MGWNNQERSGLVRSLCRTAKDLGLESVGQRASRDKVMAMIASIRDAVSAGDVQKQFEATAKEYENSFAQTPEKEEEIMSAIRDLNVNIPLR